MNHPNIVTLFGGCLKPPHIFLVEERMEVCTYSEAEHQREGFNIRGMNAEQIRGEHGHRPGGEVKGYGTGR